MMGDVTRMIIRDIGKHKNKTSYICMPKGKHKNIFLHIGKHKAISLYIGTQIQDIG